MGIEDSAYELSVRIAETMYYQKEKGREFPLIDKLFDFGIGMGLSAQESSWKTTASYVKQPDYFLEIAAKSGYLSQRQSLPIRAKCAEFLAALKRAENSGANNRA